jgi:hypothetical protein
MMEAARTSETLVNFYQTTRCYNPEDSNLHIHRRENLKSYSKRQAQSVSYDDDVLIAEAIENKIIAVTTTMSSKMIEFGGGTDVAYFTIYSLGNYRLV